MNHLLHGVARAFTETFMCRGPVLEIGSYQVPGQESLGDLRGLFPGSAYVGLDMRPGRGVITWPASKSFPTPTLPSALSLPSTPSSTCAAFGAVSTRSIVCCGLMASC